jgi:hypothetical protein
MFSIPKDMGVLVESALYVTRYNSLGSNPNIKINKCATLRRRANVRNIKYFFISKIFWVEITDAHPAY